MTEISFKEVDSQEEIANVVALAQVIWTEHYTPIIGEKQVAYMLKSFHSPSTIFDQINSEGYLYYLIYKDSSAIGYFAIQTREEELFLSKFYILKEFRSKGIGKQSIEFIKNLHLQFQFKKIVLTVNKNNLDTISSYKKFGFKIVAEVCANIGEGYVMDDYKMELEIF